MNTFGTVNIDTTTQNARASLSFCPPGTKSSDSSGDCRSRCCPSSTSPINTKSLSMTAVINKTSRTSDRSPLIRPCDWSTTPTGVRRVPFSPCAPQCDLVVFTDADGRFDLAELDRFAPVSQRYQVVCDCSQPPGFRPIRCPSLTFTMSLVGSLLGTAASATWTVAADVHRDVLQELKVTTDGSWSTRNC